MTGKEGVFRLAERVFGRYEGKVLIDEKEASITAKNDFGETRGVECKCSVGLLNGKYPYTVDAHESTYCIKGGACVPCGSEKEVERELVYLLRYFNFKEKRQLSLFDL